MGNVHMEATQINYREGNKKMSVAQAIKNAGSEITPEEKEWIDTIPELASQEIIAPEFDAEEGVYAVGDLVIYQGGLYQFTTAHETAGAWNAEEVAAVKVSDELSSLKSGLIDVNSNLTSYKTQNNINLEVPNRKNLIAMTVDGIKAANSGATWTGNTTTISGVTYTIETDDGGNVIGILANGKCTEVWHSVLYLAITDQIDSSIFLTGCPSGGNADTFAQQIYDAINDSVITRDYGDGDNNNPILSSLSEGLYVRIIVRYNYTANNLEFKPMVRPATITDPTFAPYIPSVDARLEAVESGLNNKQDTLLQTGLFNTATGSIETGIAMQKFISAYAANWENAYCYVRRKTDNTAIIDVKDGSGNAITNTNMAVIVNYLP